MIGKEFSLDGMIVQVTGRSGDFYRVFVRDRGNMYHDWYPVTAFKDLKPL